MGLGSTARAAINQARYPILLLGPDFDIRQPVTILFDDAASSETALALAAAIAKVSGQLYVLIWANDETALQYRDDICKRLADDKLTINFLRVFRNQDILRIMQRISTSLFVVADTGNSFTHSLLRQALAEIDHPILVVRR